MFNTRLTILTVSKWPQPISWQLDWYSIINCFPVAAAAVLYSNSLLIPADGFAESLKHMLSRIYKWRWFALQINQIEMKKTKTKLWIIFSMVVEVVVAFPFRIIVPISIYGKPCAHIYFKRSHEVIQTRTHARQQIQKISVQYTDSRISEWWAIKTCRIRKKKKHVFNDTHRKKKQNQT